MTNGGLFWQKRFLLTSNITQFLGYNWGDYHPKIVGMPPPPQKKRVTPLVMYSLSDHDETEASISPKLCSFRGDFPPQLAGAQPPPCCDPLLII